jgi:hypothetical protein
MLFEKANVPAVEPLMRRLLDHHDLRPVFVKGFDYKEKTGEIIPLEPIPGIPWDELSNYHCANAGTCNTTPRFGGPGPRGDSTGDGIAAALFNAVLTRSGMESLFEDYLSERVALEAYCRKRRPKVAVLPEDTDYIRGRMACGILRSHRCRIMVLAPNYYNVSVKYPLAGERLGDVYIPATGLMADRLVESGVAVECVHARGFPGAPREEKELWSATPRDAVLYALQNLPAEERVLLEIGEIVASRFPGLELRVKAHPNSNPEPAVVATVEGRPALRLLPAVTDLSAALREVRAVIAQTSTVLYHAMAAGLPVLIPKFDGLPLAVDLPAQVAAQSVVETRTQASELLERILDGRYEFFPTEWLNPEPGGSDIVIQVLESLAA